jgi:hypothetical protein
MAALANHPATAEVIFPSKDFSGQGIYVVRLFFNGFIQEVLVDDYFPVNAEGGTYFAALGLAGEFWPVLL